MLRRFTLEIVERDRQYLMKAVVAWIESDGDVGRQEFARQIVLPMNDLEQAQKASDAAFVTALYRAAAGYDAENHCAHDSSPMCKLPQTIREGYRRGVVPR